MLEYIEIRLPRKWVIKHLKEAIGKAISSRTISVVLPSEDPNIALIRRLIENTKNNDFYHLGWYIRKYSKSELENAEILLFKFKTAFEPCAEDCNEYVYNYSNICQHCGCGRVQEKPLQLDVKRLLAGKDFARTIADEWICSRNFASIVKSEGITGADFAPILTCDGKKEIEKWVQLNVTGKAGRMADSNVFGKDPFNLDIKGEYKCPAGHVRGLNILSEVHIDRREWDGSDIAITSDMVGLRKGLLAPSPIIVITQRLYRLLKLHKVTGYEVEVAHLD